MRQLPHLYASEIRTGAEGAENLLSILTVDPAMLGRIDVDHILGNTTHHRLIIGLLVRIRKHNKLRVYETSIDFLLRREGLQQDCRDKYAEIAKRG